MILDPEDSSEFIHLHKQLMLYVGITELNLDANELEEFSTETRTEILRTFSKNPSRLINAYLKENRLGLNETEQAIVASWKKSIRGRFFMFRQLKNHMVFLKLGESPQAYAVVGLTQPFEEMVGKKLPVLLETTLLPFKGQIVYDGLLVNRQNLFQPGARTKLNEIYREAKANGRMLTSLGPQPKPAAKKAQKPEQQIKRLVGTVNRKLTEVREKRDSIKSFEDETIPAFQRWIAETFHAEKESIRKLDEEIDDLHMVMEEMRRTLNNGTFESGDEAAEAAYHHLEDDKAEQVDLESDEAPDYNIDDLPEALLDEMFDTLMMEMRGIDTDDLEVDEYEEAFQEFMESLRDASGCSESVFEEAILKVGADHSEDNVSAVKKAYRKIAKRLHPDRNPDFGDEAQELWNQLKAAKESLNLQMINEIAMHWRVLQKDIFEIGEESQLKSFQKQLTEELKELKYAFKRYQTHPMWGKAPDSDPSPEWQAEIKSDLKYEIEDREEEKSYLEQSIEELRSYQAKRAKKAKSPKKKQKAKSSKETVEKSQFVQMTFDF